MIDAIATSLAGLQKASSQASAAAVKIADPASYGGASEDIVDISADGALAANSLEASVVSLKVAATMYKANAEVISATLEMQQDAFDALI